jgi:hypothetical protein
MPIRVLLSLCAVLLCLAVSLLFRLLRRQTPQSSGSNDNLSRRALRDGRADEILWSRDGAHGSAGMSRRRFIPNVIMGSFVVLLFRMVARGMDTDWRRSSDVARKGDQTPHSDSAAARRGDQAPPHSDSAASRRGDQTPHSDSAASRRGDQTPHSDSAASRRGDQTPHSDNAASRRGDQTPHSDSAVARTSDQTHNDSA